MKTSLRSRLALAVLVVPAMALAACGGDAATVDAPVGESTVDDAAAGEQEGTSGGGGAGSATLTIGSETWQFDSFLCVFGHEANQSDVYSFVSVADGQATSGAHLQMFVQIRDDSGQGRYEGDGVIYEIEMFDLDNLEDPSVHLTATSDPSYGDVSASVSVNGDAVTAEGVFFDDLTFGSGAPGTAGEFVGSCGADSLR